MPIIRRFGLGRRHVADRGQQAAVVEPIHPGERGQLERRAVFPRLTVNDLGLVQPVDRLGESIVIGVANVADRRLDTRRLEPFAVTDGYILHSTVAMVNESVNRPARMERLLKRIQHESVRAEGEAFQPTMRRAKASMTKAT